MGAGPLLYHADQSGCVSFSILDANLRIDTELYPLVNFGFAKLAF